MFALRGALSRARVAPLGRADSARHARRTLVIRRAAAAASDDATASDGASSTTPGKKKKKPPPPPFFLSPPNPPPSAEKWQNMVLLMDKPKGWTSFDVVGKTRSMTRKFGVKKVGHCGTLDPDATGLLILCVGKATKMVESFTGMDKVYTGVLRLGEGTPSQDAATEVDERAPWEHVTDAMLAAEAAAMVGEITQIPPMYSAIKVKGERLYKAARRGETVERKERRCVIHSFEVTRDDGDDARNVKFRVDCSKGTYVRTLARDLGERLGSIAHLTALRRESIGEHDVRDAWTTEALFEACGPQLEAFLKAKDEAERAAAEDARAGEAEAEAIGGDESIAESFANGAVAATSTSATAFEALPGYETSVRVLVPSAAASDASIVKKGSGVTVHATGVVEQTGETFWSTKDPGQTPFSYVAGVGAVIVGWDQAVLRRKAGETLEARIPAKEGYGEGGFPAWGIPPGGTLRFTIEVLSVENAG
jgi:tRNA pseudouridine55 synthase